MKEGARVRTMIAPLFAEVEQQLDALDRKRAEIARRYIRRLALEPYLGVPVERGCWASTGAGESTSTLATGLTICSGGGGRWYAAATRTSAKALGGGSSMGQGGVAHPASGRGGRWHRERPRQAARAERLGAGHA